MLSAPPLLETALLRRLDTLRLAPRRAISGLASGSRRTPRRGASVEFADYREYSPGDDLRSVDWNAYGRLEKLYLKLFVDEQDLGLHLLLDTSPSMLFGAPMSKLLYAKRLAAALGYVALRHGDRVSASAIMAPPPGSLHGPGGIGPLFAQLQSLATAAPGDWRRPLARYAAGTANPGLAMLLSDFYDDDCLSALDALRARRFPIVLAHILTPEEVQPALSGELRLRDAETGAERELSVSPAALETYEREFQSFCARLQTAACRHDMTYIRVSTTDPLESVVRRLAGSGGILR